MRNIIIGAVLAIGLATAVPAQETDIQATISSQLDAFQADDFAGAFAFASPNIQRLFQSPENFQRMVTQGYPMVWRPAEVRYLELEQQGGIYAQRVMITDRQGRVHVLEYRMLETGAGWRINGVQILDSAELNA